MMTIEEKLKMYRDKKNFIWHIANLFIKNPSGHSVSDVKYELWHREKDSNHYFNEWVVVYFKGGAKSYHRVSGNSSVANFQAIANLIDGGHYEEEKWYDMQSEIGFRQVDLTKVYLAEV